MEVGRYTWVMSAVPRNNSDFGLTGLRMTATEFLVQGETVERYELVDGVIVMSPRPTPWHQEIVRLFMEQLGAHMRTARGTRCFADVDLVLSDEKVYAPDIVCYRPGRLTRIPRVLEIAPDLVIEVLSPGTKAFDLTTKRDDYEKFGVGEYLAYDPADGKLRCYRRSGAVLLDIPVSGEVFESVALPGWKLDLKPLRGIDRA